MAPAKLDGKENLSLISAGMWFGSVPGRASPAECARGWDLNPMSGGPFVLGTARLMQRLSCCVIKSYVSFTPWQFRAF